MESDAELEFKIRAFFKSVITPVRRILEQKAQQQDLQRFRARPYELIKRKMDLKQVHPTLRTIPAELRIRVYQMLAAAPYPSNPKNILLCCKFLRHDAGPTMLQAGSFPAILDMGIYNPNDYKFALLFKRFPPALACQLRHIRFQVRNIAAATTYSLSMIADLFSRRHAFNDCEMNWPGPSTLYADLDTIQRGELVGIDAERKAAHPPRWPIAIVSVVQPAQHIATAQGIAVQYIIDEAGCGRSIDELDGILYEEVLQGLQTIGMEMWMRSDGEVVSLNDIKDRVFRAFRDLEVHECYKNAFYWFRKMHLGGSEYGVSGLAATETMEGKAAVHRLKRERRKGKTGST